MPTETLTPEAIDALKEKGAIVECPCCGAPNAYAWMDATVDPNTGDLDKGQEIPVYHIPTASCFEWQCGKCGAHLAERNSPILAECYTHVPTEDCDDES